MNHSICTADRATHMKIVIVALIAAIGIASLAIAARGNTEDDCFRTEHAITTQPTNVSART